MKKAIAILLAVLMLASVIPITAGATNEAVVATGYWGGSNSWVLYEDGTLELDSTYTWEQSMDDYSSTYSPWFEYREQIENVVINCELKKIGAYAFYNCYNLKSIIFVNGSYSFSVGDYAFYGCSSLTGVYVFNYSSSGGSIGEYAFAYCSSLKEVAISTGFSIGDGAFKRCSALEKIYICGPEISEYTFIASSDSFYGVNADVLYPYNSAIYNSVKQNYGGSLTWQSSFTGFCGQNVMWEYDSENKVLTVSGNGAIAPRSGGLMMPWGKFYSDITKIIVEDGINYIPSYVFEYCENVETLILPESVKYFCTNAINDCKKLNNIILPGSIEEFGYYEFNRCSALTDLYYMGTTEEWDEIINSEKIKKSSGSTLNIHFFVDCSTAPTCMNEGTETYYQFDKTDVYSDLYNANKEVISSPVVLPKTGHSFTNYVSNGDGNCNSYGTKTAFCDYGCGNSDTITEDEFADHSYDAVVTTPATHLTEGLMTYTCECGDTYTEKIAKTTEHNHNAVVTAPTCTEQGFTTYTCECGDTYTADFIEAVGHNYKKDVTAPTCEDKGFTTYTCDCGDTYVGDYVDANGHSYTSEITTPATHIKEGVMTYNCACGDTYTEAIAKTTEHKYNAVVTAPTCTEQGYTTYTCECGDSYVADYVKENGHSYTSEITTPATHLTEGVMTYTCTCGDSYTETIAKTTEHKHNAVVIAPTCTEQGYTTYTCECGDSYVADYVKENGHRHTSEITTPATHLKEGVMTYTCTCGDSYTEAIAKTPEHTYSSVVIAPTCIEQGFTVYTCECGDSYKGDFVNTTDHTDADGDECCDYCDKFLGRDEEENKCSHMCHKSGIIGFIWKVLNFFCKLFGINPVCECGKAHY